MGEKFNNELSEGLKTIQERRKKRKEQERDVDWYSWLLSDHPYLVLFLCSCLITGCVVVSVLYVKPPDFSEPSKGFEVRGTALSDRVVTWKNLYNNTGFQQTLSTYPTRYAKLLAERVSRDKKKRKKQKRKKKKEGKVRNKRDIISYSWDFADNGYFCHNPKSSLAKIVMEAPPGTSTLWSVDGLLAICEKEKSLLSHITYSDVCVHVDASTCCPTLSIANYVTYLSGLSSCEEITNSSYYQVGKLLKKCAPYFANGSLTNHCWDAGNDPDVEDQNLCPDVPKKCTKYDAVFSIFYYLADTDFLQSILKNEDFNFLLKRTAVFLPAPKGRNLAKLYYDNFYPQNLERSPLVKVTGIDFGLKDMVFDDALERDGIYPAIAMSAVMFIIFIYTGSFFITFMSVIASVSSLFMAYFFYTVIFEVSHFPFMNLTAIMVMVGIGADNVLVYCSAWQNYREKDNSEAGIFIQKHKISSKLSDNRLGVVTRVTLKHAARSMFVTGVTTASAFLSNFASTVTAIKCFGIFTGLTVLMNLFLCVTWLPASVVIHEQLFSELYIKLFLSCRIRRKTFCNLAAHLKEGSRIFFHKIQIYFVVKWRWFWLALGTALAIAGCFAIFVNPKLRLPTTSSYFQYFKSSHPFEKYSLIHKDNFAFEKKEQGYMPVRIIFGITPIDNGNPMDPDNRGHLVFNPRFNMSDPRSQRWLLQFCEKIRQQKFYHSTGEHYENFRTCFIEPFVKWMKVPCVTDKADNTPCCKDTRFPYPPSVFNKCLKKAVVQLLHTPGVSMDRLSPGPRYDVNDTLRAVIVEFPSTQPYTGSYDDIADFYKNIESWLNKELRSAPSGLRSDAWFFSDLEFHALQLGLYQGTITAIGLSMGIVCIALIVTTCNITITFLANITIAFTIFVTVGILVLLGWELNILESVTISIAIGLSVDFTVHYAVAYLLVPSSDRISRVEHSAATMGPAIALAALTTFIAGLCMLPAQVTAYYKFGTFLMLIMGTSWFYGTYFFQALCSVMGPQGRCGHLGACCCCTRCHDGPGGNRMELRNESSSYSKTSKSRSSRKRTYSDSQSATIIEMSSCTSA